MRNKRFVHHFTLFELMANTIIVISTIRKHHEVCTLLPYRDSRLFNTVALKERVALHLKCDEAIATHCVYERVNTADRPGRFFMAALVADVTRVDKLTEKFGRQRIEEGFVYGAEKTGSQLAANNNAGDAAFTEQHRAWFICERPPVRGKPERRTCQANKPRGASRNLPRLTHRKSPPLVSEVRIIQVRNNKRGISQNQDPSEREDESKLCKDRFYISLRDNDEGFDLSSSSDDELRELYSCKTEFLEANPDGNLDAAEEHSIRLPDLVKDQSDKDARRKRNKIYRGSLKKKLKVSRPSLDLEKMLARRMEDMRSDKGPENIFHPIHQM